jgi:hypothetical protein
MPACLPAMLQVPCEFPIVNPAVVGMRPRWIWANCLVSEPSPVSPDGWLLSRRGRSFTSECQRFGHPPHPNN